MKKKSTHDDNVPVYVTNMGHQYVKVDELLQNKRVQQTLREMAKLEIGPVCVPEQKQPANKMTKG